MKYLLSISLILISSVFLSAQLSNGSIAPDWTLDDINGQSHSLYDYLDDGKAVVIDFSATWCITCWNYHNSGVLESLYEDLGPGGTDEIMVFFIEGDSGTSQDCLYDDPACVGGTIGDWTEGVTHPIINPTTSEAEDLASDYGILFYPSLYGVAPNGEIYLIGQSDYDEWVSYLTGSFSLQNSTYEIIENGCKDNIDVTTIGGAGDLEYEWSNGETTEDLFALETGEYTLTITDENDFTTILGPIDIEEGIANEIVLEEVDNISCYGESDGSIFIEVDGGTGNFDIEWSNGSTGAEINNLSEDEYLVTVTDTGNGCTTEASYFISEPAILQLSFDIVDEGCNENGQVIINVNGGTEDYFYDFQSFSSTDNEIDLFAGNYELTVTDANDCEIADSFEIGLAEGPTAVASSSGEISCFNSTIVLSAIGSTTGSNISYTWLDDNGSLVGAGESISVANGGEYILDVYDDILDCIVSTNVIVGLNNVDPLSMSSYSNVIDCTNTTATISGDGSTSSGVTYEWSTPDGLITSTTDQINATVSASGTYTLLVSDPINGCSASSSVFIPVNTNLPIASISPAASFCEGNSSQVCVTTDAINTITWNVDGILLPETGLCIQVSSSSTVTATITNSTNGCSITTTTSVTSIASPSFDITGNNIFCQGTSTDLCIGLEAGETVSWVNDSGQSFGSTQCINVSQSGVYLAQVSNANNCSSSAEIMVSGIDLPTAIITGDLNICEGSTGSLCADPGGQSYEWILNGVVVGTSQCIDVTTAGLYDLNTNNGNCVNATSATLLVETMPILDAQTSGILDCNNQSVLVTASTNSGADIIWSDALGNTLATGLSYTTNLAGDYYAATTTTLGCQVSTLVVVEQDDSALPVAEYIFTKQAKTFVFDSQIQGEVTTYFWDFGDGNTSTEEDPTHVYSDAGSYAVCLTISNDCGSNSACLTVVAQDLFVTETTATDVTCFGGNDGTINVIIMGGSAPYTISTSPDIGDAEIITNLPAGDYSIFITDNDGQEMTQMTRVNEPTQISNEVILVNATPGINDGSISLTTLGGIPGFTYLWSNGSTDSEITDLAAGEYTVEVTDANGCLINETYFIMEITSTHQIEFIQSFVASPNPAIDQINIVLEMDQEADVAIELLNSLGEIVYRSHITSALPSHTIDVSAFANGIYFVNLKHQNQSLTKKIMVLD